MKNLLLKKKDLDIHRKRMKSRVADAPFKYDENDPREFPCVVVSTLSFSNNGYRINDEFVYKEDFDYYPDAG